MLIFLCTSYQPLTTPSTTQGKARRRGEGAQDSQWPDVQGASVKEASQWKKTQKYKLKRKGPARFSKKKQGLLVQQPCFLAARAWALIKHVEANGETDEWALKKKQIFSKLSAKRRVL